MIDRSNLNKRIADLLKSHRGVVLLGPRQVGKTTLAHHYSKSHKGEKHFFDLEDPTDELALQNPKLALDDIEGLLILDEVQRNPNLFPYLRTKFDKMKKSSKIILLGSASRDLIQQSSETLAGRIAYLEIPPFSALEVENQKKLFLRGGFPLSYQQASSPLSFDWRVSYITSFIERDLRLLGFDLPPQTIRRYWQMLCGYHGQIFNSSEIGTSLGMAHTTARRYLDILTGTFMVRELKPWFANVNKRQVKQPKIYIRDSGILFALLNIRSQTEVLRHPKLGAFWEGFALEEVMKGLSMRAEESYFWSVHSGAELDLLWTPGGRPMGFEFKYTERPVVTKSMLQAQEILNLQSFFVVYPGDKRIKLEKGITAWPLKDLSQLPLRG